MQYTLNAACICNCGRIRSNNEDNFFFNNKHLAAENNGLTLPLSLQATDRNRLLLAIFDGMGGENYGEVAAFAAASYLKKHTKLRFDFIRHEEKYLKNLTDRLNIAVVNAAKAQKTERMGTTMVLLSFKQGYLHVCNIGDSRAYRLRDGVLEQLSVDHSETNPRQSKRKAPLTQHLGIDPAYMAIEPHIAKFEIKHEDVFLLCSDGLTDMLTDSEISDIMRHSSNQEECVNELVQAALEHGGRDNITAIACKAAKKEG